MYHINDDGEAKPCRAKEPPSCKFYRGEDDSRHYETAEEAAAVSKKILEEKHGKIKNLKKNKYSFIEEFRRIEQEIDEAWEGVPNRFANYDIRGKVLGDSVSIDQFADLDMNNIDVTEEWHNYILEKRGKLLTVEECVEKSLSMYNLRYKDNLAEIAQDLYETQGERLDAKKLYDRTLMSMSAPDDLYTKDEDLEEAAESLGVENFTKLEKGDPMSYHYDFSGEVDGHKIYFSRNAKYKEFGGWIRRGTGERYVAVNTRSLMGAFRLKRMSGFDGFKHYVDPNTTTNVEMNVHTLNALAMAERGQRKMRNFKAQKKYFEQQERGSSARVWEDKKNPDQLHADMAKKNKMTGDFRKLEIDNDVKPEEFADFQEAYLEVKDKLPVIPGDRQPELRIRYLGRHNATGIYVPATNTVAVDVRDSSSFIHEMGHYYDIAVQNNASLKGEFSEVVDRYSKLLDSEEAKSKSSYYKTPTEVFARAFENYAHDRLGIDNRLLNVEKMNTRFDHAPFQKDPELKKKAYAMFDKLFEKK